ICDKLGRTVVFEDLREMYYKGEIISPDGYIENGVIHLNTYAKNPIGFVFKHELTHFAEKARGYLEFVRGVKNSNVYKKWLCEKMGESDIKIAEYKYKQMVANTHSDIYSASDPKAEAEMIADFVGEMLFTENGSGMASLVSDVEVKHRNKVVQFMLDLISYLKKKLSGMNSLTLELSILEDSFNRIVSEATDLENKGLYKYDNDISFCFVACTDQDRINAAEELERQGYNRLYIFKNCGLIRDAYGKWKYELNTREFKFYPDGNARTDSHYFNYKLQKPDGSFEGRLCDFVLFNSLFELYPQLKNITVIIKKADDTVRFIMDKNDENDKEPILFINKRLSDDFKSSRNNDIKSYILRELQRAIQHINGEYIGKSLTYWENKEKEGKTPYSEKLGRKLTAQEAHKYTADNYEAKIVETRRALRDTILKTDANKGRNLSNIDEAYLYSSSVERDMDILFDDNDNPFISKEYLLPSKDNSISDNKEGTTAENEVVPSLPDGTEENGGNSFEVALKKNQNSNKLRRFLSAARMIDKNDIAQNLNIRAGSDSLISNVADNAKQAAEYFNQDRINELSQKILQRIDSIGRALSDSLLEKFKNTIFKNEKGQMTSLYTLKMRGVGGFEHSKLGLVAGTLEAAEQLYEQYNDGSPRNRDVYIQEIFVNMKNPLVLNYTPYEDSIRGIHDLVEREILFHSEFINLINQKSAAKEPTYSGLTTRKTREAIQNAGYDGIIYFNDSTDKGSMTVIVFDESQMITVAENGILQQNNGIMEDYFDLAAAEDTAKKVNNDKNIKLYTADSKYNKRKYRPVPDERIKAGNSGFMEKVTRGVVNAKRELEENLAGNNEIALSGKDTVGRTLGKKITGECDKTFFKDKNGTLLSFFAYGKKIIDLEKAIKSRTFFGTINSAINDLVLSKEKSPRSLFGVIQEFYINSVAPLVVELDNLDVEAIAKQIFEEKIITEKEYYRIISPERKNPALVLINKLDEKGFDCIVFAKQTGECAVLPFDASQVFPVADNGIVKENSNVTQVDEIEEYNENYRIDRVVIEREGETPIDTQEIRNILTTERDNTIKMKLVTKVLMCNNNPAIDYSDNRTAGHSGILEKNKVNILNARAIVTALINRDFSDISIADTDTAGRIISERKRQLLRESKFLDKDGRPLSVFGFNRYGDYRFKHSQFGLRIGTLNAAHDTSLFERENSAGYISGSFEEYYPIVKNPYFLTFDPENLTPAMLAKYLLEEGTITNKQYESVFVRLGADRTAYHSGASNYLTRILKEKGIDSLAFMNERADPGSIGLIVFDKSQLIPVAIDGLPVENSDRTLADSDNEPAFLIPKNANENFVEKSNKNIIDGLEDNVYNKKKKKYLNRRPSYGKNQLIAVWNFAKKLGGGKVIDPTGKEIVWDTSKARNGQWDMGHIPGQKYSEMHKKYLNDEITEEEFVNWYRDPKNYRPELPSTNRSHKYE
ncbi:MAG: hypothetical protein IJN22_07440, partial [Clostridia bacterium]|nr:hypothetical protein [Clostridia bacterium]